MRRKCVWNENETLCNLCSFLVEELYRKWWPKILKINGFGLTKKMLQHGKRQVGLDN